MKNQGLHCSSKSSKNLGFCGTSTHFRLCFYYNIAKKQYFCIKLDSINMVRPITTLGKYLMLMGRVFARPERFRMYLKQYRNEMAQLGINSIGIVLLISFFIGAVICIQIKLNIESPWMPRFVVGYTTREILLLEFSSSIMCLILAGKSAQTLLPKSEQCASPNRLTHSK